MLTILVCQPIQPGPPHHPILGHLLIAKECSEQFPPDCHSHVFNDYYRRKYNLGKFFYMDYWPVGPQMLVILDPEMANQATVAPNLPKDPIVTNFLDMLLGSQNMVGMEGAAWKKVRAMFNPGFATGQLMKLVPYIVDMTIVFRDVLNEKAERGEVFEMEEVATRLTVDVIGKVSLDLDLGSQRSDHRIVTAFRKQVALMPVPSFGKPLRGLGKKLASPLTTWYNSRKLDRYIGEELDQRYARRTAGEKPSAAAGDKNKIRYAVDLALDSYEKKPEPSSNEHGSRSANGGGMDPSFRLSAIAQIKTFIFAGHDTTSSTIAWVFYLLHEYPDVHAKVVEELDHVLGPKSAESSVSPADKIRTDPYLVNRLPYTAAVIKETLRLFPPASSIRSGLPSVSITDPDVPESSYPTDGFAVWSATYALHRNETYFPQPSSFVPERHLEGLPNPPFPQAKPHKDAWRPFEKGPRNCIGQELALIEVRIVVALTAREFDFEAVYPPTDGQNWTVEGHKCYPVLKGTAKPRLGLPGRVRKR